MFTNILFWNKTKWLFKKFDTKLEPKQQKQILAMAGKLKANCSTMTQTSLANPDFGQVWNQIYLFFMGIVI